ncbi:hypothetical protein FRB90_001721, partial [Tulasnella sp. 427]
RSLKARHAKISKSSSTGKLKGPLNTGVSKGQQKIMPEVNAYLTSSASVDLMSGVGGGIGKSASGRDAYVISVSRVILVLFSASNHTMSADPWFYSLREGYAYEEYEDDAKGSDDFSAVGDQTTAKTAVDNDADLSSREDLAEFKPNPWTIAKLNASNRTRKSVPASFFPTPPPSVRSSDTCQPRFRMTQVQPKPSSYHNEMSQNTQPRLELPKYRLSEHSLLSRSPRFRTEYTTPDRVPAIPAATSETAKLGQDSQDDRWTSESSAPPHTFLKLSSTSPFSSYSTPLEATARSCKEHVPPGKTTEHLLTPLVSQPSSPDTPQNAFRVESYFGSPSSLPRVTGPPPSHRTERGSNLPSALNFDPYAPVTHLADTSQGLDIPAITASSTLVSTGTPFNGVCKSKELYGSIADKVVGGGGPRSSTEAITRPSPGRTVIRPSRHPEFGDNEAELWSTFTRKRKKADTPSSPDPYKSSGKFKLPILPSTPASPKRPRITLYNPPPKPSALEAPTAKPKWSFYRQSSLAETP